MEELESLILLISSGLILRYSLTLTGQAWAKSHAQTVAFMILPVITYVITKTIAGNIALSLGMIGALSIVRFRHPVKSALELIMYFDLITIGIATSVRTKWAIQLILCTIVIIFAVKIVQKIVQKSGRSFYTTSFNEGVALNSIEVFAKEKIDLIHAVILNQCMLGPGYPTALMEAHEQAVISTSDRLFFLNSIEGAFESQGVKFYTSQKNRSKRLRWL